MAKTNFDYQSITRISLECWFSQINGFHVKVFLYARLSTLLVLARQECDWSYWRRTILKKITNIIIIVLNLCHPSVLYLRNLITYDSSPRRNFGSATVFFGPRSRVNKNCFPYHFKGMSTWMEWMWQMPLNREAKCPCQRKPTLSMHIPQFQATTLGEIPWMAHGSFSHWQRYLRRMLEAWISYECWPESTLWCQRTSREPVIITLTASDRCLVLCQCCVRNSISFQRM